MERDRFPLVPYAAVGDFAYGGKLHRIVAGSLFAGSVTLLDARLSRCGSVIAAARSRGDRIMAELYYVTPLALSRMEAPPGLLREYLVAVHGGHELQVTVHLASTDRCSSETVVVPRRVRLLLALPPLLAPPVRPLAIQEALLAGAVPCPEMTAFCHGGNSRVVVADLYSDVEALRDWLEDEGLTLAPAVARRVQPPAVALFVHVPLRAGKEHRSANF
ncbi:MAG: hypothetical protein ABWW70_04785 [Thermoproteota archaeon]